jgi:hypothetical protein
LTAVPKDTKLEASLYYACFVVDAEAEEGQPRAVLHRVPVRKHREHARALNH